LEEQPRKLLMVRPERLELPTLCSEGRCSIQLSYGRVDVFYGKFGSRSRVAVWAGDLKPLLHTSRIPTSRKEREKWGTPAVFYPLDQNPHPVSPKNGETRMGHPRGYSISKLR
jgi:hypothetical protein